MVILAVWVGWEDNYCAKLMVSGKTLTRNMKGSERSFCVSDNKQHRATSPVLNICVQRFYILGRLVDTVHSKGRQKTRWLSSDY